MSYQKNDVLTVKIEDMGHDGEGIGKCEGYTLFVKDTVIGDLAEVKVIKAKKNYGYARLMRLIEPSPHRVEPICPVARPCGGCQLQMLDYAEQLRFKEKKNCPEPPADRWDDGNSDGADCGDGVSVPVSKQSTVPDRTG